MKPKTPPAPRATGDFPGARVALVSLALLFIATVGLYLSAEQRMAGGFGMGLDDSWIHAVMARNIAEGHGYSFNPGHTVDASTAPLYTAILAGWYFVAREVVWGAKLIGLASFALMTFLLYRSAFILSRDRLAAWLTAALCLLSPAFLWGSLSGMETALYLLSPAAALYFWTREKHVAMMIALAAGVWLRPEAVLLLGLGFVALPRNRMIKAGGIAALIVLPYFAMHLALSGYLFPATVRTKSSLAGGHFEFNLLHDLWILVGYLHAWLLLFAVPFGARMLFRKAWWAAIFPLAYFIAIWSSSVTLSSLSRYGYPLLPFLFLMMGLSVAWLREKFPARGALTTVVVIIMIAVQGMVTVSRAEIHGGAVSNIQQMQVGVARIAEAITLPTDSVATNDIGAMGWFSGRYVLDVAGLIHPVRPLDEILREYHPPLLTIFDAWYPERLESRVFRDEYRLLGKIQLPRNYVCGSREMSIYGRTDRYDEMLAKLKAVR